MKENVKKILLSVLFLCILTSSLYYVNWLLRPKYYSSNSPWPSTETYNGFYNMKKNTVDVLFLGSSVAVNNFCPQKIYNDYGIRSYNLGSEQQSIILSYFWLEEALRFQKPKVVVLEGRFLYNWHPESPLNTTEGLTRKCIDPMHLSLVKMEAIDTICKIDKKQTILSYYLTNFRFHTRWKGLNESDFVKKNQSIQKGWLFGKDGFYKNYKPITTVNFSKVKPIEKEKVMEEYFVKIRDLCKKNEIKLITVITPQRGYDDSKYVFHKELCRKHGVDRVDLNEEIHYRQICKNPTVENVLNHGNFRGNMKISAFIGKLLHDKYKVKSFKDIQFENTKFALNNIEKNYKVSDTKDIDNYLRLIKDDRYTIIVSAKDDAANNMKNSSKLLLKEIGFKQNWDRKTMFRKSYIGVKTNGEIYEYSGGPLNKAGRFRNKNDGYRIKSSGYKDLGGAKSSILVKGREYSKNSRGLNFVIYDNELQMVIDSVCFDTCGNSQAKR